jgi:phosphoribosylaminoimidazole-succinocarboxamide synthase
MPTPADVLTPIIYRRLAERILHTNVSGLGPVTRGKVRDIYRPGDVRVLVVSDRISAFDRVLGTIPLKGQVLNQLAAFWFENTADIVDNHVLDVPHPNATVCREAEPLPVEVVVRGYITGVTSTSLWTQYAAGVERPYGLDLPRGLKKNDPLPEPVITPTTKADRGEHDVPTTEADIVASGMVSAERWAEVRAVALALYERGRAIAASAGLILVDTKYEFGIIDGRLTLIDEVHTPDSSRYWVADSYDERRTPKSLDKEHVRSWLKSVGYSGDGPSPPIPDALAVELSLRYIQIYEQLTGRNFEPAPSPVDEHLSRALASRAH